MPRNAALVWVSGVIVMVACSDWPRFAHLPPDTLQPATGPVDLLVAEVEDATVEFTDDPRNLIGTQPQIGGPYSGRLWGGELGWQEAGKGESDFPCPQMTQVPTTYQSDVDFIAFSTGGGSICITVRAGLDDHTTDGCGDDAVEPLWEMPLYELSDGCAQGDWLNRTTQDAESNMSFPEAHGLKENAGLFYPALEPGDYALFLAGVCGGYLDAVPGTCPDSDGVIGVLPCVPYKLAIAVVPTQEACTALHEQLESEVL